MECITKKIIRVSFGIIAVIILLPKAVIGFAETSHGADLLLTETDKARLYLYEKVGYDFVKYRKLASVVNCESGFDVNAYNPESKDAGLFQINIKTWNKTAEELGYDYRNSWKDNIDVAFVILEKQGIKAWRASYQCHKIGKL